MNRKGITPIIAAVLLLMMTVAAAGLAYQFVIGTQTDIQEGLAGQVQQQQLESQARLSIDSVYKSGANMMIVIRNTGAYTYSANELALYVDGQPAGTNSGSLAPKATISMTATNLWPASVGASKGVRVVPQVGSPITYTCTNQGKDFC